MIELLNIALAGGVAAAAAPIVIHIAHRRKLKPIEWGAMRFLLAMLQRKRRSLSLENLLLLTIRVLAIACLAFALTRPNLRLGSVLGGGDQIARSGKTAAVLVVDDGLSSAEGRTTHAIETVKKLALAYLDTLKTGDEISIIPLSRLGSPTADPIYDLAAAKEQIKALAPTAVSSDVPGMLDAAVNQLQRHINGEAEVVLVSDGRNDGWRRDDRARWDELVRKLSGPRDAIEGSRVRPHLVLLAPEAGEVDGNLAVTSLQLDRALVPAGRPVGVRLTIAHVGRRAVSGTLVRLLVNGRPVAERALEIGAGETREISFSHTFAEPGSCVVEGAVEGARDPLPADDRRALSVHVEHRVPVLLVEGRSGTAALDGSLGLVAAALDPAGNSKDLFTITRIPLAALNDRALSTNRVVVLGDLPALDAAGVAAIEHFVVAGGGVLVGLGPNTNPELVNRFWARGGDGFMPCTLTRVIEQEKPAIPTISSLGHPALTAFTIKTADAWKDAGVRRFFRFELGQGHDITRILTLDGAEPLLVERQRGLGKVAALATSMDGSWGDLPLRPAFVPLIRGVVGSLGAVVLPPRNLAAGERLAWCPPDNAPTDNITAEGPDGLAVALNAGVWEGRRAVVSEPLLKPGTYQLRVADPVGVIRYAVTGGAAESRLEALTASEIKDCVRGLTVHRVTSPARVAPMFTAGAAVAIELARWLVLAAVTLLFVEIWLTRRMVSGERMASAAAGLDKR